MVEKTYQERLDSQASSTPDQVDSLYNSNLVRRLPERLQESGRMILAVRNRICDLLEDGMDKLGSPLKPKAKEQEGLDVAA